MTRVLGSVADTARVRHANKLAVAMWAVVICGSVVRLARFVDNRSFWLDESLLGLNLIGRSTHDVLRSLDYVQSAPQGFLLAEKAALVSFGETEQALRLLPLLASVGALILFALVARRLLAQWPAVLAVTLFAVNEPLIYQSSEAKPYSSDVTVALLIAWLALRAFDAVAEGSSSRSVLPLAVAGTIAVWFSYPSIFVLAAAFCGLVACAGRERLRWLLLAATPIGMVWLASFLVLYNVSSETIATVRRASNGGDVHDTLVLETLGRVGWASLTDPVGLSPNLRGVGLLCLVIGIIAVTRFNPPAQSILLIMPGALAIVAVFIDKYPAGGRFWLFLAPFAILLVARGTAELAAVSRRPLLVGMFVALLLAAHPLGDALRHVPDPPKREHVRPLLQELVREWRPGDLLYAYVNTQYALRFYGDCKGCDVRPYPFALRRAPAHADAGSGFPASLVSGPSVEIGKAHDLTAQSLAGLNRLLGRERVWLLFSHVQYVEGQNEEQLTLAYLDNLGGRQLKAIREPGAALYLYDLRR